MVGLFQLEPVGPGQVEQDASDDEYEGSENLEVMLDAHNYNDYLKALVRRYGEVPQRVLDFGAGIGTFTDAMSMPGIAIDCIEPDSRAREQLASRGYGQFADISDLDDEQYDYIFSLNVLEHIEDDAAMMATLAERLVPGSRIFIYVPAFNHIRTSMDDLVGHHRRYTRKTLIGVVEQAGLVVEEAAYTDFLGYFATLLFKLMDVFKDEPDGTINRPLLIAYDRVVFPVSRLLSVVFGRIVGKNVYVVARKPVENKEIEKESS